MSDLYVINPSIIVMYSTTWCGNCKRAKKFLTKQNVPYIDVDIEDDEKGREFVMKVNDGARVVPTIIFPDGEVLVEPSTRELRAKTS